jgi:hypothetical protein
MARRCLFLEELPSLLEVGGYRWWLRRLSWMKKRGSRLLRSAAAPGVGFVDAILVHRGAGGWLGQLGEALWLGASSLSSYNGVGFGFMWVAWPWTDGNLRVDASARYSHGHTPRRSRVSGA